MNLLPLVNRLEDAQLGVKGTNLFMQMMPIETPRGILLREPLTGTPINHELPGFYRARFQVIVRSTDYDDGKQLMEQVMSLLTLDEGFVLSTQTFNYCRPQSLSVSFPLSRGNLIEHSVYFEACYVEQ